MVETVRVRKDGTRRDVELRGVAIQFRGQPHVLYIGRDISERKRAEASLRTSEEQYRSIFNAAADALVLRDSQARVVDVNPAFLEISGYSREEVIRREPLDLRRARAGRAGKGDAPARDRRRVGAVRGRGRRKDGSRFVVEMRAVPILYRGQPHALGMARDITQRKALEVAPAPGAAHGGARPPHRRRGARLQQPARRDHGLHRARFRAARSPRRTRSSAPSSTRRSPPAARRAT